MTERLTGIAPAKVNLVLEVTGVRADGYHEIDTVLQTLELADEVIVEFGVNPAVRVAGPFASGTPADSSNLAWRAAALLAERSGQTVDDISITLVKQIPAAGGLGGGASDAATVLWLLGERWGASKETVAGVANAVGSDPAFFVAGGGTVRARGRGEQLTPLLDVPAQPVVLFVPEATLERKTARMFAALDRLPFDDGAVSAAFASRLPGVVTATEIHNAFERVAFDLFPGLSALWERIEERSGEQVH
ncbi:MAG: 4-(cytidine 5'-diphospho)-2-C-methyl-D-erythritol kinase, partial [Tepidiformaceae bacterium]